MKNARGKTRELLLRIGEIQDKVGTAIGLHYNDKSQTAFGEAQDLLQEVFELCVEARSDYHNSQRK